MKLKYFTVFLDGIDKCGKDTIRQLVWLLDKRLNVYARGIISLKAYSKKFNRDCEYIEPFKNANCGIVSGTLLENNEIVNVNPPIIVISALQNSK